MYCKQCGRALDISSGSCPNCGTAKGLGQGFCPDCGSPRASQSNFCQSCGFNFSESTAPVTHSYGTPVPNNSYNAQPLQNITDNIKNFDFKGYANEYADNFKSVVQTSDKMKLGLRYGACAASVLLFLLSLFPVISLSFDSVFFEYNKGLNLFSVSSFGGMMFVLALLASVAVFLPQVQKFISKNPKLEPFVYLIVPLLELLGMLSMLIGVNVCDAYVRSISLNLATVHLGFCGWLILILSIAAVGVSVYSFFKYDFAFVKANNPLKSTPTAPKDSISDAINGDTYQNTAYYGNDIDNNQNH